MTAFMNKVAFLGRIGLLYDDAIGIYGTWSYLSNKELSNNANSSV